MVVLSIQTIRKGVKEKYIEIIPYDDKFLTPCGYLLRCNKFSVVQLPAVGDPVSVEIKEALKIYPGERIQISSLEKVTLPDDIMATVHLRSSYTRYPFFLSVPCTPVIHPGWNGYISIQIIHQGYEPVGIKPEEPIAHIIFFKLDQKAEKSYDWKKQKYKGDKPQPEISEYVSSS